MKCLKCNKITKKGEIISMDKCSKCVSLCNFEFCKKKSFKNGYCHCHVTMGVPLKLMMARRSVTEEDLKRRELNDQKIDQFNREVKVQKEQILHIRSGLSYEDTAKRDRISRMEEELKIFIDKYKSDLDDEIDKLRTQYKNATPPSFETPKKPKKYTSWNEKNDKSKESKRTKQDKKAERTSERYGKPESHQKKSSGSEDYDESSDDGDELLSEFGTLVKDAFVLFEIPRTSDLTLIKAAYYKRARVLHPDRHVNDIDGIDYTELFQELGEAYDFVVKNISKM